MKAKTVCQKESKSKKLSPQEFAEKCEWEGGIHEGFEYGLRAFHLDDSDLEFKEAVKHCENSYHDYKLEMKVIEGLMSDFHEKR